MARKRRKGLKGSYKSSKSANRRRYSKIGQGSPVTQAVPRGCALVQGGEKKGKLRKGCRIGKSGVARCDVLTRLPATAMQYARKGSKKRIRVECPS